MSNDTGKEATSVAGRQITVPGFDDDLVDPKVLKKALKELPQDLLVLGLRSSQVAVRANSAVALGLHGDLDDGTCLALAVLLRDESAAVRGAAARGLVGATDRACCLAKLLAASGDADAAVRSDIASTVAKMGDAVIPDLIAALKVDPARADIEVVPHLVAFGSKAEQPTVAALDDDDERVRANAVATLMLLGTTTLAAHQDRLGPLMRDPSAVVRGIVLEALGAVRRRQRPGLLESTEPPTPTFGGAAISDAEVKRLAADTTAASEAILLHFCRDGREVARRNAWRVFAARGTPSANTTALAAVAAKDPEAGVRLCVAEVLGAAHADHVARATDMLVVLTGDSVSAVVEAAQRAIDVLGKAALAQLLEDMDIRDGDRATLHIAAVVRFGQAAGKGLADKINHGSPVTRTLARTILGQIGGKALVANAQAMVDGLHDSWDPARAASATGVAALVPDHVKDVAGVLARLKYLYEEDAYLIVRDAAERALQHIGSRMPIG